MDEEGEARGIHWRAPTHTPTSRTNDWYWALGLLALFGVIVSVWLGNLFFAAIIALATFCVVVVAVRTPREHDVAITESGVVIDHELYPYTSIHSFWVADYMEPLPKLFLTTSGLIHPHIAIPLTPPAHPEDVREALEQFVPEEAGHSLGTWLGEMLGL